MAQRGRIKRLDSPKTSLWQMALANNDTELIGELLKKLIRRIDRKLGIDSTPISPVADIDELQLANLAENPEEEGDTEETSATESSPRKHHKPRTPPIASVNLEARERAITKVTEVIAEILKGIWPMPSNVEGYLFRVACTEINEYFRTDMPEDKGHSILRKDDDDSEDEADEINRGFRFISPPERKTRERGIVCAMCSRRVDDKGICLNPQCVNCPSYDPYNPKAHVPLGKAVDNNRKHHKETSLYDTSSQVEKLQLSFYSLWRQDRRITHEVLQLVGKEANLKLKGMPPVAGEVMTFYLWGHKPCDIYRELGVLEESTSRIKKKWFDEWKWDNNHQEEVRLCLLCHNLVDIASEVKARSKPQTSLYMAVTTDQRTKAWFGKLHRHEQLALARFVNYLRDWGWGLNPRENKRAALDDSDDWGDLSWGNSDDDVSYRIEELS